MDFWIAIWTNILPDARNKKQNVFLDNNLKKGALYFGDKFKEKIRDFRD